MERPKSHHLVMRMITPLAVWAVTKMLDQPKVKSRLQDVDDRTHGALRRVRRNAGKNRAWLAGGAAAVAIGLGMITRASRPK
jgi:hypothetical protein